MVLKSRNTMVVSAVLFLIVVILLRFAGGLFEDNIAMFIGSIFGGNAESVPLIDFSSINLSWLNPSEWSMGDAMSSINAWLHDMIDSVLPAMINMLNTGAVMTLVARVKLLATVGATKFAPVAV